MNLNDLKNISKATEKENFSSLQEKIGSDKFFKEKNEETRRIKHPVDFATASNFARYGSAEKYYSDAIANIYTTYPYDGSRVEKQNWKNSASDLELYFLENIYPKTTGYITLGSSSFENNTVYDNTIGGQIYKSTVSPQYVLFYGGPHGSDVFEKSNILDEKNGRASNLEINGNNGNTVEFWFKRETNSPRNHAILDIWNNKIKTDSSYGRLLLEMSGGLSEVSVIKFSYSSGSSGVSRVSFNIDASLPYSWHHYAISAKNNNNDLEVNLYIDGKFVSSSLQSGAAINTPYSLNITGCLGAYQYGIGTTDGLNFKTGSAYGSFDEFRFWKEQRSEQQIRENLFSHVAGGTNTDNENVTLGVYYKFNEGLLETTQDANILDYSGRISNGYIYNFLNGVRSTGSAIENYNASIKEEKDPIIYSTNKNVVAIEEQYSLSGSMHDLENINSLINTVPSWILDEEEKDGSNEVKNLIQVLSSYLDHLHIQTEYLNKIKYAEYTEGKYEVYPFYDRLLTSSGFKVEELFNNASVNELFLNRNDDINFEEKIQNVKNEIYRNIYNNLIYLYKSKGTEKSLRNLLRCFGIDEELIKINVYSNNETVYFEDKYEIKALKKKLINFNSSKTDFGASVFQKNVLNEPNERGYIFGSTTFTGYNLLPVTVEAEIVFPLKFEKDSKNYIFTEFVSSSLFGLHSAVQTNPESDFSWQSGDPFNFQVYAVRPFIESKDAYFYLTSSAFGGIELSSSVYKNVYNNEKWNFAVRIKNSKDKLINLTDINDDETYAIEFYGVNMLGNSTLYEFSESKDIPYANIATALNNNQRLYAGAHRQNFTGSVLQQTDIKLSYIRYWLNYISDEAIKEHALNYKSVSLENANRNAYFGINGLRELDIPNIETLALNWDFSEVSGSDSSGNFNVYDISSTNTDGRYGVISDVVGKKHTGWGYGFSHGSSDVVIADYVNVLSKKKPETLIDVDMVQVLDEDVVRFKKDLKAVSYHIIFEKSMYQTISDEMLKLFSSISDLNTIIGHPINKKRNEYKELKHLNKIFFDKILNTPNLEKYMEFYKWIDSSVMQMMKQFIPAGANFVNAESNIIESHFLERNKIVINQPLGLKTQQFEESTIAQNTFPVINSRISYQEYKSPASPAGKKWYTKRAIRGSEPSVSTPSNPSVDATREQIRKAVYHNNFHKLPVFYDKMTNSVFNGNTDNIRVFSSLVNLSNGELTYQEKNRYNLIKTLNAAATNLNVQIATEIEASLDEDNSLSKQKVFLKNNSNFAFNVLAPFRAYKDTITGQIRFTNVHEDIYGSTNDIGMQGIFANTHVGGNIHRHNPISSSQDRIELYSFDGSTLATSPSLTRALYREERVKRPINISNIKHNSETSQVGNYSKGYEVLGISSREAANISFINSEGAAQSAATNSVSPLFVDASLQERTPNTTVITSRFSSGDVQTTSRGALDSQYEEYSVYNSLNNRNIKIRKYLDKWSSSTGSFNETSPSYHKIYKNPLLTLRFKNTSSTETELYTSYDNNFVNYQIPKSDAQYSWIASSITGNSIPSGYINYGKIPNLDFSSQYQFLSGSSSSLGLINFAGIFTSVSYSADTSSNQIFSLNSSDNLNEYLSTIGNSFGFNTWNQIRVSDKKISSLLRANNKVSLAGIDFGGKANDIYTFIEPPYQYNFPTKFELVYPDSSSLDVTFERENLTSSFANGELLKLTTGSFTQKTEERYNNFKKLVLGDISNPSKVILKSASYKTKLFPRNENIAIAKTRKRGEYAEVKGTGSNGYDRRNSSINTFWRDDVINRGRTTFFEEAQIIGDIFIGPIGSFNYASVEPVYRNVPAEDYYILDGATALLDTSYFSQSLPLKNTSSVFAQDNRYGYRIRTTSPIWQNSLTYSANILGELAPYKEPEVLLSILKPSGTIYTGKEVIRSAGGFNISSSIFQYNEEYFRIKPRPQLLFINNLAKLSKKLYLVNGGADYKTDILSNNKPWFDTYEKYYEDINPLSYNKNIVPEFKISKHLDYFIKEKQEDFFKSFLTGGFLEINGNYENFDDINNKLNNSNNICVDVINENIKLNRKKVNLKINANFIKKLLPYKGFYPSERTLQLADHFFDSFFGLTTEQIHTVNYSDEKGIVIHNQTSEAGEGSALDSQVFSIMQPLFAPGILYNTIKSGIAVDWPTFITGNQPYSSSELPSFYKKTLELAEVTGVVNIGKQYNFRFPFESLIEFDSIIPKKILDTQGGNLFYLQPTYYSQTILTGNLLQNARYPSYDFLEERNNYNSKNLFLDRRYKSAMHNFLAESVNFFLDKGRLVSFKSANQGDFGSAISGTTYSMDIIISTGKDFSFFALPGGAPETTTLNYNGSAFVNYFGPQNSFLNDDASDDYYLTRRTYDAAGLGVAYAPHSPPYYYGESIARINFTAQDSRQYTIQEIIENCTIDYLSRGTENAFISTVGNEYQNSPSYKSKMTLDASLNFKEIIKNSIKTRNDAGVPISETDSINSDNYRWSIQTKFETPVLNFNTDLNNAVVSDLTKLTEKDPRTWVLKGTTIWYGYGEIPQQKNGVNLTLAETDAKQKNTGSLIELCGFERSSKEVGKIAEKKTISEAIVLIPYTYQRNEIFNVKNTDNPSTKKAFTLQKSILGENGIFNESQLNNSIGPYYFGIDKEIITDLLNFPFEQIDKKQLKIKIEKDSKIIKNSILNTMDKMIEYNIPPHLDWVTNKSLPPFVMYIIETYSDLDKNDLSDIWQGLMPKIAKTAVSDSQVIEHPMEKNEMFHGAALPEDIRWKIFKVKKKAKNNYYELKNSYNEGDSSKFEPPTYSYNWPYDYFSLIELADINFEAKVVDKFLEPEQIIPDPPLTKAEIENSPIVTETKTTTPRPKIQLNNEANNPTNSAFGRKKLGNALVEKALKNLGTGKKVLQTYKAAEDGYITISVRKQGDTVRSGAIIATGRKNGSPETVKAAATGKIKITGYAPGATIKMSSYFKKDDIVFIIEEK